MVNTKEYDIFLRKLFNAAEKNNSLFYDIVGSNFTITGSIVVDSIETETDLFSDFYINDINGRNVLSINNIEELDFIYCEDTSGTTVSFYDKINNTSIIIEFDNY